MAGRNLSRIYRVSCGSLNDAKQALSLADEAVRPTGQLVERPNPGVKLEQRIIADLEESLISQRWPGSPLHKSVYFLHEPSP